MADICDVGFITEGTNIWGKSINQSVNHSVNQPTNQPINQSIMNFYSGLSNKITSGSTGGGEYTS